MKFLRWLDAIPGRVRSLFPWSREGRQTLIYIVLALCGPALTACIMWALAVVKTFPGTTGEQRLAAYVKLADPLTWALLIIVAALACFVSIRSIKLPGGTEVEGNQGGGEPIRDGETVTINKDAP